MGLPILTGLVSYDHRLASPLLGHLSLRHPKDDQTGLRMKIEPLCEGFWQAFMHPGGMMHDIQFWRCRLCFFQKRVNKALHPPRVVFKGDVQNLPLLDGFGAQSLTPTRNGQGHVERQPGLAIFGRPPRIATPSAIRSGTAILGSMAK